MSFVGGGSTWQLCTKLQQTNYRGRVVWLSTIDRDVLNRLVIEGECMYLAKSPDGTIHWASDTFCNWSGYSLYELERTTWIRISVDDENLEADRQSMEDLKNGLRSTYRVEKKYITKNGSSTWGILHARREPLVGEFQFAWCTWHPLKNVNAEAFERAMVATLSLDRKVDTVITQIKVITSWSPEETWTVSTLRLGMKYPKLAAIIIGLLLTGSVVDTIITAARAAGYIATPVKVQNSNEL